MTEKYIKKGVNPKDAKILYSLERKTKIEFRNFEELVEEEISYENSKDPKYFWDNDNELSDEDRELINRKREAKREKWLREIFFEPEHSYFNYRLNENGDVIGLYIYHFDNKMFRQFPKEIFKLNRLEELYSKCFS